jgi:hypothetical protein
VDSGNPVEVYRAGNSAQAHLMASALEDAGIKAIVDGDALQLALGDIPLGWPTAPRILVAQADAVRARELVQQLERGESDE